MDKESGEGHRREPYISGACLIDLWDVNEEASASFATALEARLESKPREEGSIDESPCCEHQSSMWVPDMIMSFKTDHGSQSELPSASIFYYDLKGHYEGSSDSRAGSLPSRDGLMARIRDRGIYVHGSNFSIQMNFIFEYHLDDISLGTFETEVGAYNPDLNLQSLQIRTTYRYLVGALWPDFTRPVRKVKLQEVREISESNHLLDMTEIIQNRRLLKPRKSMVYIWFLQYRL